MFGQFGQIASLLKNLPRMQEEMEKFKAQLAQLTAEADAGGGMVRAKVNGNMEVLKITITDDALQGNDRELLEDLVAGAVNQALRKIKQQVAEETTKMAAGMGMGGLGLPPA